MRKITAIFLTAVVLMAMAAVPVTAFDPNADSALAGYFSFDGDLGGAQVIDRLYDFEEAAGGTEAYADGVKGQAFHFNGETTLNLGKGLLTGPNVTVALWMSAEDFTTHTPAFWGYDSEADAVSWISIVPESWADAEVLFWSNVETNPDNVWFDGRTGVQLETNQWVHIAFSTDGETVQMYINGELLDHPDSTIHDDRVKNISMVFANGTATAYLGGNNWDPQFQGKIDEVYLFNRVLSGDEIAAVMNHGTSVPGAASASAGESPEAADDDPAGESPEVAAPADETPEAADGEPAGYAEEAPEAPASPALNSTADDDEGNGMILWIIIAIAAVAIIVIIVVLLTKKKK